MRTLKILALSTLAIATVMALGISVGAACDGTKAAKADATSASAAGCSAKAAEAKTASASGCASKAADATTASAAGCPSKAADATTASAAGCSSKAADATTASAAGCCAKMMTAKAGHCASGMPADLAVETVRMPSGALAVFYSGKTDAMVASLHAKIADGGAAGLGCDIAKCVSSNEACRVEAAKTAHGVMLLVTSDKADVLDSYQERYTVAMATPTNPSGE